MPIAINGSGTITGVSAGGLQAGAGPVLMTEQVASGTSIDFTGIPSWAKRITVMFNALSTNGTSVILVQIGSGASYTGTIWTASANVQLTQGFPIFSPISAGYNGCGVVVLCRLTGNIWCESGNMVYGNTGSTGWSSAGILQSAPTGNLDRIRITTVGGTDTFDAGSINVMYE